MEGRQDCDASARRRRNAPAWRPLQLRSQLRLFCLACTFAVTTHAVPSPRTSNLPIARRILTCAFTQSGDVARRSGVLRPHTCPRAIRRSCGVLALRADGRNVVERAAIELAAAEQVEKRYRLEVDLRRLQAEREEELEKEEWDRILRMVEKDLRQETDEEPGPWELTPDLLAEMEEVFSNTPDTHYLRIALGDHATGKDIVGEMTALDDDLVQNAFDTAIEQQKEKGPKSMLSFLGLDFSSLSTSVDDGAQPSGLPLDPAWDSGLSKSDDVGPSSDDRSDDASFMVRKFRLEKQVEEDYKFLVMRSRMLAERAYLQGRAPFPFPNSSTGHKVPWELVERRMLELQNSILRGRDPPQDCDKTVCRSAQDDDVQAGALDEEAREALRLPDTSMWMPGRMDHAGRGDVGGGGGWGNGEGATGRSDSEVSQGVASSIDIKDLKSSDEGAGGSSAADMASDANANNQSVVVSIGAQGVDIQGATSPMSRCCAFACAFSLRATVSAREARSCSCSCSCLLLQRPLLSMTVLSSLGLGSLGRLNSLLSPRTSILQSQLDWELASFRDNVEAIRMSTEELIKDVRPWFAFNC